MPFPILLIQNGESWGNVKTTVLLVNYDDDARKLYGPLLIKNGVNIFAASTMTEALLMLVDTEYSFVVINGDYFEYLSLLKVMRKITAAPIGISVTHYNQEENHIAIVNGADIYRVRYDAATNRVERFSTLVKIVAEYNLGQRRPMTVLSHGNLQVFPYTRKVYVKNVEIRLFRKEFDILLLLITNKGIVLSYELIFRRIWGEEYADNTKELLWNQVSQLRKKLKIDPEQPDYIINSRHYGYCFDPVARKK